MLRHPRQRQLVPPVALLVAAILCGAGCLRPSIPPQEPAEDAEAAPSDYLFCFWNVENFFDDKRDGWKNEPAKDFDAWFADNPKALHEKLDHLSKALVELNGGRGPDILGLAEVESERAAELLKDALNKRLRDESLHYHHVLFKDPHGGRHIATALITRLPVEKDRTQLHGHRQRILETHLHVNGHELVVIVSHWTSRITDKDGHSRADYADKIYGRFRAMYERNPAVDFLVCGDFNDTPDDPSVTKHLHAVGDVALVRRGGDPPLLLDLFAGKDPNRFGTHYHHRWFIFDQICVSPGMLDDKGWSCDPSSAEAIRTLHKPGDKLQRPWEFGREQDHGERGYSDHFPVTVRLKVQPN